MARLVGHRTRRGPYVQIEMTLMEDPTLTFKAKALYGWLLDRSTFPGGWDTDVNSIVAITAESTFAVRAGLVELEEAGYLTRTDAGAGGRGKKAEWHVYEEPETPRKPRGLGGDLSAVIALDERGNRDVTPTYPNLNNQPREGARSRSPRKSTAAPRGITDSRALLLATEVWESADPKPALGFAQVRSVARKLVAVRPESIHELVKAMLAAPTITVAAVEIVLNRKTTNGHRPKGGLEDLDGWAAAAAAVDAKQATTTKEKR